MAVYTWKHALEIPPPSEENWQKEEEEDFFLQDPERKRDVLPQPFRMVNKLVMLVFENAMEIIERREMLREEQKLKVQPTECFPTAEFQVQSRDSVNCHSGFSREYPSTKWFYIPLLITVLRTHHYTTGSPGKAAASKLV